MGHELITIRPGCASLRPEGEPLGELVPVDHLPGHWRPWPPPDGTAGAIIVLSPDGEGRAVWDDSPANWAETTGWFPCGHTGWRWLDDGDLVAPTAEATGTDGSDPDLLWRPVTAQEELVRVFGAAATELDGEVLAVPNGEGLSRYRASEAVAILVGEPYPSPLPGHEDATDPDPYADSRALGALIADVRYALAAIRAGDREEAQEVLERALARHPEIEQELGKADPA